MSKQAKFDDLELPKSLDLEKVVLGCLLNESKCFEMVEDVLSRETFTLETHRYIFDAMRYLYDKQQPIDILSVAQRLRELKVGDSVKVSYLTQLSGVVNTTANLEYWAASLVEFELKRKVCNVSDKFRIKAREASEDAFELLEKFEKESSEISGRIVRKDIRSAEDIYNDYFKIFNERFKNPDAIPKGVLSGFSELDELTGGFQEGNLIIVAGRPGMGKTAFALSMIWDAVKEQGKSAAFFSLEMESFELIERLASLETEINSSRIRKAKVYEYEFLNMVEFSTKLSEKPLYIDDTPALSLIELRSKARKMKHKHNIDIVFVDYLQLMTDGNKSNFNRESEVASISRGLKKLAKELKISVVAMAQLSRASESRGGDKRPVLSDLRESGSIEQDADMVMLLYRPEYYQITSDGNGNDLAGQAEVILAKNRSGSSGSVWLNFKGAITKFSDPKKQNSLAGSVATFENEKLIDPNEVPWA